MPTTITQPPNVPGAAGASGGTGGGSAKARYEQLVKDRQVYEDRAREAAKVTIPSLFPKEGHNASTKLVTPYQSIGARGLNNLAAKRLLTLLPPNEPFFRLAVDTFVLKQELGQGISDTQADDQITAIQQTLSLIEKEIMTEIERSGSRVPVFEALKQLIVAGNVLLYLPPDGGVRVFRLTNYVVKRDPVGNPMEIVVQEMIHPSLVPDEAKATGQQSKPDESLELYTHLLRDGDQWKVHQEVEGKKIPGSEGTHKHDELPWLALRFSRIDGEDYGRGHVEEYLGDLRSAEKLSKSIVLASLAAAKVIFLVKPNAATKIANLIKTAFGGFAVGNRDDVSALQVDKFADMRIAQETLAQITERLGFAFLLNSSVQRSGERVTAEEIRLLAGELQDALGGVDSVLSQEFQIPLVKLFILRMTKSKQLPKLPKVVSPTIITGIQSQGRTQELDRLVGGIQTANNVLSPEAVAAELNASDVIERIFTAAGIDTAGLIKTAEQKQQQQQQQSLQQMIDKLGPQGVTQLGSLLKERMKTNG